jgi:predicted acyltransferase
MMQKVRGIAVAGVLAILLGGVWNAWFPINKKLWTSSYVLFAGGLSLVLLAVCLALVDRRARKAGESRQPGVAIPFLVFGTNAIAAYVFSELLASALSAVPLGADRNLQQGIFGGILRAVPDPAFASLLYSLGFVAVCWLFVYVLYRRRIFLKI